MQKNQREIKRIHEEIKEDYAFAVKKSVVDFVLKEPEIDEDERFLDEDDETPMTIELAAVSEAWKKLYRSSKRHLTHHLHLINQCMLQAQVIRFDSSFLIFYICPSTFSLQTLWHKSFVHLRLIDVSKLKSRPKIEMLPFQDLIYQVLLCLRLVLIIIILKGLWYLFIVQEIEKGKRALKEEWCPGIISIFRTCQVQTALPSQYL